MTDLPAAGPELDALVAEALGIIDVHDAQIVWTYGVSINDGTALRALEAWREQHPDWTGRISLPRQNWSAGREYRVQLWRQGRFNDSVIMGTAPTLAGAICRAIVLAGSRR